MINRHDYINAIVSFIDNPVVKNFAGIRRNGKSTIFKMLLQKLLQRGVPENHFVNCRYTEMDFADNLTAKVM